ncbi:MAG: 3'-5' exonuclease [Anaerolineae bacterium]
MVSETDNLEEESSATTLLTLHAAKGLEFPVVFITGLEDGRLPHSRSLDDGESLAEERRLFYVGLTRAKDKVFLSHAFRRMVWGDSEVTTPSRFLYDIPVELTVGGSSKQKRKASKKRMSNWSWSAPKPTRVEPVRTPQTTLPTPRHEETAVPTPPPALTKPQFHTGETVQHKKFGQGTVIESKLTGNDEEVTVAFKTVGVKRLAASFAKLEKVAGSG